MTDIKSYFKLPEFYCLDEEDLIKSNNFKKGINLDLDNDIRVVFSTFSTDFKEKEIIINKNTIKKTFFFIRIYFQDKYINLLVNRKAQLENVNDIMNKINQKKNIRGFIIIWLDIREFPLNNYYLVENNNKLPKDIIFDKVYSLYKRNNDANNIFQNINSNQINYCKNNFLYNPNNDNTFLNNNFNNIISNSNNNLNNNNFNNNTIKNLNRLLNEERKQNAQLNQRINELKEKLSRYPFKLLPGEKMMTINFRSLNQDLTFSVICKNTDLFKTIESKLYKAFPNYNERENYFTVKEIGIDKEKSLEFNNIQDNDIIPLIPVNSTFLK